VNLQANGAPTFLNTNTTVAVFENSTQVGVFSATDPLSLATTYTISARTDASNVDRSKFSINTTTGVLSFVSAPDFEVPTDDGADNLYKVVVRATNANGYAELPVDVAILDQTTGAGETPVDRTPPVYVMGALNGTALTLFFSEATTLNSANGPAANAFAVAVGGTPVTVSSVSVNATAKTVTLTLASALSTATGLTVAYTDPSSANDTAAIQDIAGNDAASFSANSFKLAFAFVQCVSDRVRNANRWCKCFCETTVSHNISYCTDDRSYRLIYLFDAIFFSICCNCGQICRE
jgi:uncharacterized repeat protein (TIGR02059 family)